MQSDNVWNTPRFGDYFALLRRRWLILCAGLLLGIGAAIAYLQWAPKEYTADAYVLVNPTPPTSTATRDSAGINLDTEAQLVTATNTLNTVAKALNLSADDAAALPDNVSVTVPPSTEILDIAYVGSTPTSAQKGALAFANAYLTQRTDAAQAYLKGEVDALQAQVDALNGQLTPLVQQASTLSPTSEERARADQQINTLNAQLANLQSQQSQIKATTVNAGSIVTQPVLPTDPSSPNTLVTLAAGIVLGLLAGLGLALLRDRTDDLIRTPEDLYRRTRVPVATVLAGRLHSGEVSLVQPMSGDGRGYARLRNLVTTTLEQSTHRVILVAGVRHGSGPVAANLATSLARAGEEVVLVCADVFGDTAASLLGEAGTPGLGEVLAGEAELDAVLRPLPHVPGLRVLSPGRDPDRADALLQTRSPRRLVEQMLTGASYVIMEAPATADSPDAQTLANAADVALIVVTAGQTSARDVLDACGQLESMNTPVLGAVVARYARAPEADRRPAKGALTAPAARTLPAPSATATAAALPANGTPVADARPGTPAKSPETVPPGSRDAARR